MAPLTLVANLATRWGHLHWLRIWPPDGTTCIDSKVGHQVTSHALPHCLGLPYWHYQLVLSLYLHQLESHQLSLHNWLSEFQRTRPIDRTRDTCLLLPHGYKMKNNFNSLILACSDLYVYMYCPIMLSNEHHWSNCTLYVLCPIM